MSLEFNGGYASDDSGDGTFSGAALIPTGTFPITVLSVCNPHETTDGASILDRWAGGAGNLAYLLYFSGGGHLTFVCHNGFDAGVAVEGTQAIITDEWQWLSGRQSGSQISVQINGAVDATQNSSVPIGGAGSGDGAPYTVAAQAGGSGGAFHGLQKFTAVWKSTLTDQQLLDAYNDGVYDLDLILAIDPANLVGAWDMDDLATDLSGRGYPLTNHGGIPSDDNPPEPAPAPAGYPPALGPPIMHGRGAA